MPATGLFTGDHGLPLRAWSIQLPSALSKCVKQRASSVPRSFLHGPVLGSSLIQLEQQ